MYITGSYSTSPHIEGSIKGFKCSAPKDKWLRIHPTQEWHDLYSAEATDDLQRFFDRYLSGKQNGGEASPRVRLSLLRCNPPAIRERPETEYPPSRVQYQRMYLDTTRQSLTREEPRGETSVVTYAGHGLNDDGIHFKVTFDKYTDLIGFSKATLFMSTDADDDIDVYVVIRKLDKDGKPLVNYNIPLKDMAPGTTEDDIPNHNLHKYIGPNGCARASWRHTLREEPGLTLEARKLTSPAEVLLSFEKEERITPGQIVKLDIQMWPGGIVFEKFDSLSFEVKGDEILLPENAAISARSNPNKGSHAIYTGERYPRQILLPLTY